MVGHRVGLMTSHANLPSASNAQDHPRPKAVGCILKLGALECGNSRRSPLLSLRRGYQFRHHVTLVSMHDLDADAPACLLTLQSASHYQRIASGRLGIWHSPGSKDRRASSVPIPAKQKELVRYVPRLRPDPEVRPRLHVGLVPHDALAV